MSFLTAAWRKLALANYIIDPKVLAPFVPKHTELDLWNGKCYVSLVGFMFTDVKLLGWSIPFHTRFEEVNLRFYVRHKSKDGWKRGVVFIKELVPKPALSFVANTIYKEHYQTVRMKHQWLRQGNELHINYDWKTKGAWQSFGLVADHKLIDIEKGSEAEFITEHYWGYTKINENTTNEYEVTHPKWQQYLVLQHDIQVDFAKTYGESFRFLNELTPHSVQLAEGSAITVEGKREL